MRLQMISNRFYSIPLTTPIRLFFTLGLMDQWWSIFQAFKVRISRFISFMVTWIDLLWFINQLSGIVIRRHFGENINIFAYFTDLLITQIIARFFLLFRFELRRIRSFISFVVILINLLWFINYLSGIVFRRHFDKNTNMFIYFTDLLITQIIAQFFLLFRFELRRIRSFISFVVILINLLWFINYLSGIVIRRHFDENTNILKYCTDLFTEIVSLFLQWIHFLHDSFLFFSIWALFEL